MHEDTIRLRINVYRTMLPFIVLQFTQLIIELSKFSDSIRDFRFRFNWMELDNL